MRGLAPVLVVACIPLLAGTAYHHERRVNEKRLGAIATDIAGRAVEVRCPGVLQRLADVSSNAGSVYFDSQGQPADYTQLDEATCAALDDFAERDTSPGDAARIARSLHVLAHESFHLAGVRNEAEADCYGLQRTAFVARQLGANPDEAQRLAYLALLERAQTAPPEYRSADCHDGGPLDLDRSSSVWP
jgi:hypothetical protein